MKSRINSGVCSALSPVVMISGSGLGITSTADSTLSARLPLERTNAMRPSASHSVIRGVARRMSSLSTET